MAISSPLLETSIDGAHGVLINITGSTDIGLEEVEQAASLVQAAVHPDANTIFGATFDENMDDEIRVTVIATGFEDAKTANQPKTVSELQHAERFNNAAAAAAEPAAPAEPAPAPAPVAPAAAAPAAPVAPAAPAAPAAPVAPAPAPAPEEEEKDPFEDIFKIFNRGN